MNSTWCTSLYFFITPVFSLFSKMLSISISSVSDELLFFSRVRVKNSSIVLLGLASFNVLTMLEMHQATLIWHSLIKHPIQIFQSRLILVCFRTSIHLM